MSGRTRKIILVVGVLVVLCGVAGILYPFIGAWINSGRMRKDIDDYKNEVAALEDTEAEEMLASARAYNDALYARTGGAVGTLTEEEEKTYQAQLAMSVTTIMGYLEIPKIGESLPIYHGTSEAALQEGVGHLEGSSLPVGGTSTHTVLTGHSGLPSKKILTELDRLENGDTFTVTVLNETLTYEVDGRTVLLPEDVDLTIREGADECTLVTCTPIGANTHRLLVHAHRVPTPETPAAEEGTETGAAAHSGFWPAVIIAAAAAVAVLILIVVIRRRKHVNGKS